MHFYVPEPFFLTGAAALAGGLTLATPDNSPLRRRTLNAQMPFASTDEVAETTSPKAQALAPLVATDGQAAEFLVPGVVAQGGAIEAHVFGAPFRIVLPEGAQAGQWLRLHFSNGVVSCERLAPLSSGS